MPGSSLSRRRRQRKPKLEPISYEEMVGAAGMSGFVSFLEISPTDSHQQLAPQTGRESPSPAVVSNNPEGRERSAALGPLKGLVGSTSVTQQEPADLSLGTHNSTIPQAGRLYSGTPNIGVPETGSVENIRPQESNEQPDCGRSGIAHKGPPEPLTGHKLPSGSESYLNREVLWGVPHSGIPTSLDHATITPEPEPLTILPVPYSGTPFHPLDPHPRSNRIRRASRVQDGHSLGEQALYDALWQAAQPYSDNARIITAGYRTMSDLARLTVNNCKANIRALIHKLAVSEAAPFSHSHGTTYIVHNFSAILQRRKAAGLTHCIRSRGVVFIDPESGIPLTPSSHIKSGTPGPGIQPIHGVPESDEKGIPRSDKAGVPQPGPPKERNTIIRQQESRQTSSTSLPVPQQLVTALQQLPSFFFDHEAVTLLWNECQMRVPDCTIDEVVHFAGQKAAVCRNGKIQNPVGFLLTAVPKCFEGEAFQNFRAEQVRVNEEERKRKEAEQEKARVQTAELYREQELHQRAEERLQALSKDDYQTLHDTVQKELNRSWKNFSLLTEEARELNIKSRMLRELQEKGFERK
jgi:hypothetical protein